MVRRCGITRVAYTNKSFRYAIMGSITLLKNQPGLVTPAVEAVDSGWSISGIYATHVPCSPGYMKAKTDFGFQIGHTYSVNYTVDQYSSGGVKAILGTANGITRIANGKYSENITCAGNTTLQLYSDGGLRISNLYIYDLVQPSVPITISFNERANLWSDAQSFVPERMLRFGDSFYSFKNGQLYLHNANDVRNNFYGQQYSSQITFYVNAEPASVKLLHNIIEESNGIWQVVNVTIKPYPGKLLGMQSRIKKNNFKELQGIYYADFLKNMLDPRFNTQIEALLRGEELRGRVMEITIQNDDTKEINLFAVDVKYSTQMLTP